MSRIANKGLVVPLIFFWSFFVIQTLILPPPPNNALLANLAERHRVLVFESTRVESDCTCDCVCSCRAGPLSSWPSPGAAPEDVQLPLSCGPLPPQPGSSLPALPALRWLPLAAPAPHTLGQRTPPVLLSSYTWDKGGRKGGERLNDYCMHAKYVRRVI